VSVSSICSFKKKTHVLQTKLILFSLKYTVEFRFFETPREMEIGSKNRGFEKLKVASNHTCFTVVLYYKIQEGRQQRYITLVNVWTIFIYQLKRAFKTKRKFKDLSQFRQNKNQYCTETCVCNFARTLRSFSFPLVYSTAQRNSKMY